MTDDDRPLRAFDPDEIAALLGIGGGETRHGPHLGTKALMLAVLEEAIRDYLAPGGNDRARAESWVGDAEPRSVFSFNVVCETLGLEPPAVRAALGRMRARHPERRSKGRIRPNARRYAGETGGQSA